MNCGAGYNNSPDAVTGASARSKKLFAVSSPIKMFSKSTADAIKGNRICTTVRKR